MKMGNVKRNIINIVVVLGASIIAILVHALMPSPGAAVNVSDFDSVLVKQFGFPIVASAYFVVLYVHILLIIKYFVPKSTLSNKEIGIRYGSAFGLMYLVGMQEVVVSASPFDTYGFGFVIYQFFIGLGDAIPVLILCLIVTSINKRRLVSEKEPIKHKIKADIIVVAVVAIVFFVQRTIGYLVGYIESEIQEYPVPVLVWTIIFGVVLGVMHLIIRPIYNDKNNTKKIIQIVVLSIGVNWIWFNCFIGLILDGMFLKMLSRSLIDVVFVTFSCLAADVVITKKNRR